METETYTFTNAATAAKFASEVPADSNPQVDGCRVTADRRYATLLEGLASYRRSNPVYPAAATDPRAFAAAFGRRITGSTTSGYRSRRSS